MPYVPFIQVVTWIVLQPGRMEGDSRVGGEAYSMGSSQLERSRRFNLQHSLQDGEMVRKGMPGRTLAREIRSADVHQETHLVFCFFFRPIFHLIMKNKIKRTMEITMLSGYTRLILFLLLAVDGNCGVRIPCREIVIFSFGSLRIVR